MSRPRNPNRKRRPYRPRKPWTPVKQLDLFGDALDFVPIGIVEAWELILERETAKAPEAKQGGQSLL